MTNPAPSLNACGYLQYPWVEPEPTPRSPSSPVAYILAARCDIRNPATHFYRVALPGLLENLQKTPQNSR